MKILAISHLYPHEAEPRFGIFVARQLEAMAKSGADITLLVPRPYRPKWLLRLSGRPLSHSHSYPVSNYPGIDAVAFPYPTFPGKWYNSYCGTVGELFVHRLAQNLHRKKRFDVIYGTGLTMGGDIAWRLGRRLNIPSTALAIGGDVHVVPYWSPRLFANYQKVVGNLDGLLTCGESIAEEVEKIREDKALCVYGVVDLQRFQPLKEGREALRKELNLPWDKKILLYVGYLSFEKGLRELIKAFETIGKTQGNACLVLCGEGPEGEEIKAAAEASAYRSSIHFAGPVQPDSVARYMQASDVFVLPSYTEGMPNAVMEAMACGLPVVSTTVGGLPAAVGDCPGAILVEPKDHAALAIAILEILGDPNRQKQMQVAALRKAEESFGAMPNARKILTFLSTVIERQDAE